MSNRLYLWGDNSISQIGNSNLGTQNSPLLIAPSINVVAAGGYHTIGTSGVTRTYVGCGDNSQNQLTNSGADAGVGAKTPFRSLSNDLPANIIQVEAGLQHSLYLASDGTVTARGNNTYGQGNESLAANYDPYIQISAGNYHNIALNTVGQAYIWGRNNYGQIGNAVTGSTGNVVVTGDIKYVAAGDYHTAIITGDNRLYLCGLNNRGQLGDNTQTLRMSFIIVGGTLANSIPLYWSKVSLGTQHSAAITTDGDLYTWGYNLYGQLGLGDTNSRSMPILVSRINGHAWTEVSAGNNYTLAINANGDVYGWGLNTSNQLGDGTAVNKSSPTYIQFLVGVSSYGTPVAVKAGPGYHSAALFSDVAVTTTTTTTTAAPTTTTTTTAAPTTTTTTTTTVRPQIVGSCMSRGSFSKIQLRRATNAQFISANTILASGEPGYATDTRVIKVGDGYTPWSALLPVNISGTIDFPTLLASNNINISSVGNTYVIGATGLALSNHQHTLSDITGLSGILNNVQSSGNYAPLNHQHVLSDITDFNGNNYAPIGHQHVRSDIADFNDVYSTSIYNLGSLNYGNINIDWAVDKQIQTGSLSGTAAIMNKGNNWPSTNDISRDVLLDLSVTGSSTNVSWPIITNWYSSPPNPLPVAKHLILLRAMGTSIYGHYLGSGVF